MEGGCINCGEQGDFVSDYSSGSIICRNCGTVQPEQIIDEGKEWRDFVTEDSGGHGERGRTERVDEEFHSLGTEISLTNFGSNTLSQTAKTLTKYSRMANSSEAARSEQNLKEGYIKINELCEILHLNDIVKEDAKHILRDFENRKKKNMKGHKKDAFVVAVLLLACKHAHSGRTLKSLARMTYMDEKEIKKFYKMLLRDPHLVQRQSEHGIKQEVEELVEVFCKRLQQPYSVTKDTKEIASRSIEVLEGKKPASIAAAAILYVMKRDGMNTIKDRRTDIATVAGVSVNTLRNVFNELKNVWALPGGNYYKFEEPS